MTPCSRLLSLRIVRFQPRTAHCVCSPRLRHSLRCLWCRPPPLLRTCLWFCRPTQTRTLVQMRDIAPPSVHRVHLFYSLETRCKRQQWLGRHHCESCTVQRPYILGFPCMPCLSGVDSTHHRVQRTLGSPCSLRRLCRSRQYRHCTP